MKNSILVFVLMAAVSVLQAQPQRPQRPPTPNDNLVSFAMNEDGSATFRLYAPEARSVALGGDLSGQKTSRADNGVWTITTAPDINPSAYRYFFLVDGMKVNDPKNPMVADFRPMVDVVPASERLFWQRRDVPHGAVSLVYYPSEATGTTRRMHVWTPPGYFAGTEQLPVLYLLHGGGDNDTNWPGQGRAGWILDNLIADGKIVPMVVVMPDGSIPIEAFADDLGNSIIPHVEANFRVLTDTPHRAIAGLSMGGLQLMETLIEFPDKFAYVNVMSSGWFTSQPETYAKNDKRIAAVAPILKETIQYFIFTAGGESDAAEPNTDRTRALFEKHGIESELSGMDGGHTMYVWRHDLRAFAQKIFR